MTLLRDRIWLPRDVKAAAATAVDARFSIERRVYDRRLTVGHEAEAEAVGWGQFLDTVHHSETQWGLLGTSAGYQVLARAQLDGTPDLDLEPVRRLLPEDVRDADALHPAVQAKAAEPKCDLQNIIRLAFVAEALAAGKPGTIVQAPHPPIIEHILALARHGRCWNPRSAQPGGRDLDGHAVTTAYVLHALRRYEDDHTRYRPIRAWLARQLLNDALLRARPDYVALVGLALTAPEWDNGNPEDVRSAVERCRETLMAWRRKERSLVVNRPLFAGYQLGQNTDYLLFNPELLAALFFLRLGNPRPSRRFVAAVARDVGENALLNQGFEGQLGTLPTIDQEWACRLLHLFAATYQDPSRRHILLPGRLTNRAVRWGVFVGLVLLLAGTLLAVGVDFRTGVLVFVAGAVATVASLIVQKHESDE